MARVEHSGTWALLHMRSWLRLSSPSLVSQLLTHSEAMLTLYGPLITLLYSCELQSGPRTAHAQEHTEVMNEIPSGTWLFHQA